MYSYKIQNLKAPHRLRQRPSKESAEAFMDQQMILGRHLNKCFLKVGDRVRFKRPKRNPLYGTVVHAEEDAGKCEWRNQTIPLFLTVDVDKVDKDTGVRYATEKVRCGLKQLMFVHSGD